MFKKYFKIVAPNYLSSVLGLLSSVVALLAVPTFFVTANFSALGAIYSVLGACRFSGALPTTFAPEAAASGLLGIGCVF